MNSDVANRAFKLLSQPATAQEGLRILEAEADRLPDSAKALFDLASANDMLDREAEANVLYQRVRTIGLESLPPDDQPRWYVQAGSTLRLLGRFDQSRTVLSEGIGRFPDYSALHAFRALTDIADGQPLEAAVNLLDALLGFDESSLQYYGRALRAYRAEITGAY
jgi:tetratricopeptide (TPR) repeat protein